MYRRRLIIFLAALALLCGVISGCGGSGMRSVRFGTYISRLCKAVGPFEAEAQTFGNVLSKRTLRLSSRKSKEELVKILVARNEDSLQAIKALEAVGVPEVGGGRQFAVATIRLFKRIAKSDLVWRYELLGPLGPWVWPDPSASRAKRERLLTSVGALVQVGHQFERLPHTREGEEAMARSTECKNLFGSGSGSLRRTASLGTTGRLFG